MKILKLPQYLTFLKKHESFNSLEKNIFTTDREATVIKNVILCGSANKIIIHFMNVKTLPELKRLGQGHTEAKLEPKSYTLQIFFLICISLNLQS